MLIDPRMCLIEYQPEERDVVSAEASGFLPDVAVLVQPDDGQCVSQARAGVLPPDADLDQPLTDLVDGWSFHVVSHSSEIRTASPVF